MNRGRKEGEKGKREGKKDGRKEATKGGKGRARFGSSFCHMRPGDYFHHSENMDNNIYHEGLL